MARKRKALPIFNKEDYVFLGKKQGERYQDLITGETISKRQFRNRQLMFENVAGSLSEWERATQGWVNAPQRRKTPAPQYSNYQARVRKIKDAQKISDKEARKRIARFTKQARREGWSRDADGALAQMLAAMGMRPLDADYNVGDTP